MACTVRPAREADAGAVSAVIRRALRETSAADYPPDVIDRIAAGFGPEAVRALIGRRRVFVAVSGDRIVGTAGLEGAAIRTVFVAPDAQGRGVGRRLMAEVERAAREAGVARLTVPASITAQRFYARLGYAVVGERHHGQERTFVMARDLERDLLSGERAPGPPAT